MKVSLVNQIGESFTYPESQYLNISVEDLSEIIELSRGYYS